MAPPAGLPMVLAEAVAAERSQQVAVNRLP
jgi:hypothetical protein